MPLYIFSKHDAYNKTTALYISATFFNLFYELKNVNGRDLSMVGRGLSMGGLSIGWIGQIGRSTYGQWETCTQRNVKVRGPFVETFCIEKDSYIDAI